MLDVAQHLFCLVDRFFNETVSAHFDAVDQFFSGKGTQQHDEGIVREGFDLADRFRQFSAQSVGIEEHSIQRRKLAQDAHSLFIFPC